MLASTGNRWHLKASLLIKACRAVLENVDGQLMGERWSDWSDEEAVSFVDNSMITLIETISFVAGRDIASIEAYFRAIETFWLRRF